MKKVFFLLSALIFCAFGSENFLTDYKLALTKAKSEHKLVALTIVQTHCPWCYKFENETLKDKTISQIITQNFVHVVLNRDTQELPSGFKARLVPTTFFLNANGDKIADPAIGFFDNKDFDDFLEEAIKKAKK